MTSIDVDWGELGLARLLTWCDAVAIVDVLSFSTCVTVAADREITLYPVPTGETGEKLASQLGARLAKRRVEAGPADLSLSPLSLMNVPEGGTIVLPSPNGSALSAIASRAPRVATFAGCIRNRRAVARALQTFPRIGVLAAGERWPDHSLRPAIEDWLGVGAIVQEIQGTLSPEAEFARTSWRAAQADLMRLLHGSQSGQELAQEGYIRDVDVAAELDGSDRAQRLVDGAYRA